MRPGHEKERAAKLGVVPDARLDADQRGLDRPAQRSGRLAQHRGRVAEHRRRGVGVVAVEDDLHLGGLAALQPSARSLRE